MNWKARIETAMSAAGPVPDNDILEELAQHARAIFDTARADGLGPSAAAERVDEHIAIWCRQVPQLKRRPRHRTPIEVPASGTSRLVGIAHDVRYALRLLRRRPGASLVSMLTMALGIGVTTVLFSVAWGVLFKPLPWPDADRLVRVSETRQGSTRRLPSLLTNGTYLAWRESPSTIEELAAFSTRTVTLTGSGAPQRLRIVAVTPTLFPMLRARAALGVPFASASGTDESAIVLSYGLWQQRFGGRNEIVGTAIQLDGKPHTVVAVMPRAFAFPDRDARAWVPFRVLPVVGENAQMRLISVFGALARLKPGATPAQAAAEATARGRGAPDPGLTATAMFGSRGPVEITAVPLLEAMTADVHDALLVFLAAVGLLLATATANVAGVQLAQSTTRRREMAIRSALGAGGGRISRQLLIESGLLGVLGGALGLLGALWLHRALPALLPADFPRASDVALDFRVMAFAIAVSVIASVLFGFLPALHARRLNLVESLSEDSLAPVGGFTRSKTARARAVIIAGQVAVASVLLIGASLLTRTFVALLSLDRGYDTTNVLTARVPTPGYTPQRRAVFVTQILERLRATPGVAHAAFSTVIPLGSTEALLAFVLPPASGSGEPTQVQASQRIVSPSYFEALGMRIVEGRGFSVTDTATSRPVVVVNRAFVQRYFGSAPLGRMLPAGFEEGKDNWQVVGVVDDVRMRGATDPPQPEVFVSYAQLSPGLPSTDPTFVVRTTSEPTALVSPLRSIVVGEDPALALDGIVTMEQRLLSTLARPRLYAILLGGFAAFALTIAAVGLFGVLSYTVAQRSREIAVRSALGARPWSIVRLVVGQGLVITLVGLIAGVAASLALGRWMSTFLYGVSVHDPLTYTVVPLTLIAVAVLACLVPARRAAKLDPLKVLRAG